jgi:hypothetical protein
VAHSQSCICTATLHHETGKLFATKCKFGVMMDECYDVVQRNMEYNLE